MVKCSNCAARWMVSRNEAEPEPAPPPEPPAEPEPYISFDPEPEETPAEAEVVQPVQEARLSDDPPLRKRPVRRPPPPPPPKAPARAVALAVLIVGAAAAIAGGVALREKVVKQAPAMAGIYAVLGLSVNDLGLVIEEVKAEPAFEGGRPVLNVSGVIRNLKKHEAEAPPLEVSLLDKAGEPISVKIAHPVDRTVPPMDTRHFALTLTDPPSELHDLEVRFKDDAAHPPAPVKAPAPADGHAPDNHSLDSQGEAKDEHHG